MNDPPRWSEPGSDAPDEVRELLAHGVRTKPIDRRALVATAVALTELGARPAIAGALAKLIAIPQAVAALPAAVKVVTTIAVASAVVVTTVPPRRTEPDRRPAVQRHEPAPVLAAPVRKAPEPLAAPALPSVAPAIEPAPIEPPALAPLREPARAARMRPRAPEPASTSVSEPAPPVDALAAEVAWLDEARAALAAAPARALSQADAHARRFPDAALGIERELVAIDALLRLDRKPEATRRAAELRARFPRGLYERRLAALLE